MVLKTLCAAGLVAALLGALPEAAQAGKATEIFPLAKIRRGQTGYGLTTMQGTTPERFDFEVIGVAKNFLPKMDIILVKSDDKKLEVTGFWQGMSGSPLFIEGKLACAFSYGFRFNKVAIGGCTPIEYMKREGFRVARHLDEEAVAKGASGGGKPKADHRTARRLVQPESVASFEEWKQIAPGGKVGAALDRLGAPRQPWLASAPLPPPPADPGGGDDDSGMIASAVPLAMSGFSAPAFAQAKQLMSSFPVEPMQAGGTGSGDEGPTEFGLGGAIAVELVRGDMAAAVTGTVSFVDGDGVLAFGHPMFQSGELYAPVAAAEIHTVIPSAQSAFIVSSPLRELGTLVQDRQSCIAADTGKTTKMIPLDIYIDAGEGKTADKGEFHVEILNNRFFTADLAGLAAMNAVSLYLPDRDHVTAMLESKVWVKGYEPLHFTDYYYSATGASGVIDGARGLRVLVPLMMNPFGPVEVERVELKMKLSYDKNFGDIRSIKLASAELEPGKKAYVDVRLDRYDGASVTDRVPFMVPESLAGSIVNLEVTAGDAAALDAAPPENLDDLMDAFRELLPGDVYAVTLFTADEGAAVDGKVIRDLPSSAQDKLHTGATTAEVSSYRAIARSTSKARRVVNGRKTILVKVAAKK